MIKNVDFENVLLSISHARSDKEEYELLRTENGATVTHYCGFWGYRDDIDREDCIEKRIEGGKELYGEICVILESCRVSSWNGFNKGNRHVLDGSSFTFTANIDGKRIYATGENNYPRTFRAFLAAIKDILNREASEKNDEN